MCLVTIVICVPIEDIKVKQALWSVNDDKAPSGNGYIACFSMVYTS